MVVVQMDEQSISLICLKLNF